MKLKLPRRYILGAFLAINILVWYASAIDQSKNLLTVAFLDIGQGDAIFIQTPGGSQVLFDAGPNRKVIEELGRIMPFFDRSIDMLVVTNPDKDHIGGFLDVLDLFEVDIVLEPGTFSSTATYEEFEKMALAEGVEKLVAERGMKIILDEGVYLEILFPDKDVSKWNKNDGSIVAKLVHGENSFLLTGDAPSGIEKYLLSLETESVDVDVLKVGHHGSRTSTSDVFVEYVSPEYAVISYGKGNRYSHPHPEVLANLRKYQVKVLSTAEEGTIVFQSDGKNLFLK